jgi:hypothetical protein
MTFSLTLTLWKERVTLRFVTSHVFNPARSFSCRYNHNSQLNDDDDPTMSLAKRSLALWISSSLSTSASSFASSPKSLGSRASVRYFRGGANTAFSSQSRRNQIIQTKHRFMSSSSAAVVDNPDALRVALCQFPVTDNKEKNHETASDYLQRAADSGAKLVVLPEIWCSP